MILLSRGLLEKSYPQLGSSRLNGGLTDIQPHTAQLVEDTGRGMSYEEAFRKEIGVSLEEAKKAFIAHSRILKASPPSESGAWSGSIFSLAGEPNAQVDFEYTPMSMHILALAFAATFAAVPSSRLDHADLLRKMPATLLDRAGGAYPDANGMVGHNREGFKASAFQRGATLKLAIAAARGDERRAEDCWRAVEAVFVRQTHEGHFNDPPSSVAFWLCELNRALLVVQQGLLAGEFKGRIEALLPKIRLAADWLAGQRETLFKVDGNTPNRLFFDAEAFAFSGLLLHDEKLVVLGKEFLARGMKLYRDEDGVFLEHGGGDSSYQAVCLLRL